MEVTKGPKVGMGYMSSRLKSRSRRRETGAEVTKAVRRWILQGPAFYSKFGIKQRRIMF